MSRTTRIAESLSQVGARAWNQLDQHGNPFLSWGFLNALEATGSVASDNGWQPFHLCIYEDEQLVAAAPTWLKAHSRGEFVFDWAWADAYHQNQLEYYPKLLTAVPWTPVGGPRLLVAQGHPEAHALRLALAEFALAQCEALGLSSWHCNFVNDDDARALSVAGLLERKDCQFHWRNRDYQGFDDFLATLKSKKRKNIRHERRQVAQAGIRFERRTGASLGGEEIAFLHRCYQRTFHAYGNHPALTLDCFERLAADMQDALVVVLAFEDESPLAMSMSLCGGGVLYGRYWGTLRDVPGLHFETAYYQGIEYCIEHGLSRFESGAQGEHKIARGFEPSQTRSFHYIAHPGFRQAIASYLQREQEWQSAYRGEVERHVPFRLVSGR